MQDNSLQLAHSSFRQKGNLDDGLRQASAWSWGSTKGWRRQLLRALLLVSCLCLPLVCCAESLGQSPDTRERLIKAAYLLKFPVYVTWPNSAFEDARSPLVIGILADGPMNRVLGKHKASSTKIKGREIVLRYFNTIDDYQPCHVLFIPQKVDRDIQNKIISQTQKMPILLVGEKYGFATAGGVVNFYIDTNQTIGFEINRDALVERELEVDARLLRLSKVVRTQTSKRE